MRIVGLESTLGHARRIRVEVGRVPGQNRSRRDGQSRVAGLYMLAVRGFGIQQWKYPGQIPSRKGCAKKSVKVEGGSPDMVDGAWVEQCSQRLHRLRI